MHTPFVDFLNHGTLPFVGRLEEQERILRFWQSGDADRSELRIGLLLGEAGSGKSRLIDETLPLIESREGVVVHVKLRPEGSISLAPLIATGIERSESARNLSPRLSEVNLSTAIAALRRLGSLRRTLLVLEDIHLLESGTLREFALLIEALADEPLALLAIARPLELAARGIVEGYLNEEIILEGLSEGEVERMWKEMFLSESSEEVIRTLMRNTKGNALAIRSALRGSLRSGSVIQYEQSGHWQMQINPGAFGEIVQQSTHGLVDGMIADLTTVQRQSLHSLAMLGEVFSQEGAQMMIGDIEDPDSIGAGPMIETLIFKGLLAHSRTAVTAFNDKTSSRLPIAFTHTLLHDALVTSSPAEDSLYRLVDLLSSDAPLYSLVPYRLLGEMPSLGRLTTDKAAAALSQIYPAAQSINVRSDWQSAPVMLRAAEHLTELLRPALDHTEAIQAEVELLACMLGFATRYPGQMEYYSLALRLYDLTQGSEDEKMLPAHIHAITHLLRYRYITEGTLDQSIIDEATALVEKYRTLRSTRHYRQFLHTFCTMASNRNDSTMLQSIEHVLNEFMSDDSLSEQCRRDMMFSVGRYLLTFFTTPQELENRIHMLRELESIATPLSRATEQMDLFFYGAKAGFLKMIGDVDGVVAELGKQLPYLLIHGMVDSYFAGRGTILWALGMTGEDLDHILERARECSREIQEHNDLSEERKEQLIIKLGRDVHNVGIFRGDTEFLRRVVQEFFSTDNQQIDIANRMLQALWEKRYEEYSSCLAEIPPEIKRLGELDDLQADELEFIVNEYRTNLSGPLIQLYYIHNLYITLALVEYRIERGDIAKSEILDAVETAINNCLDWFAERNLHLCMSPLLARYGGYLDSKLLRQWQSRVTSIAEIRKKEFQSEGGGKLRVSMIDTITIQHPGGEVRRLRGGRNQTALGLLVASAMLKKPLDRGTFFALASGVTDDPERARIAWNIIATRLREAIGRETFSTSGDDIPELNLDVVHVDLLDVWNQINKGEQALRRGHLVAARESCRNAISMAAGKVIFPTLYDELFETLREEFENRLRTITLGIAQALLAAGDAAGAEQLLQRFLDMVADDEEIAELLGTALDRLGRKSESVLVRGRVERAM